MEGINQFTDWTSEEFLLYLSRGWRNEPKIWGEIYQKTNGSEAPLYIDWRNKSAVTGVKDQGMCGSSWSFSATGAIEGQLGLKGNLFSLSEQNLIDCSPDSGCRGGSPNIAFDYVRMNGIESEVSYPYIGADGSCAAESSSVVTKISKIVKISPNDEDALQDAIASVGPISVAIDATENLQRYKAGILDDNSCRNDTQNHAVLVVGYGRENNTDYYIIKNSWGDDWGEQGYFRLTRNRNNMCGISSTASFPVL
ncbi:procathepsin L-like [Coccinella septempunctata]|uniref:procathepsin L-like n=1 Tax=Coccinella septempunctata TaxID=41139 RepID=UPI001D07602F|nr:procathepsin L-like [Coccinella septempunctata]